MPMGLNPSFACQGFLPLCFQGRASSAGYHARQRVWLLAARICWEWSRRATDGCCRPAASMTATTSSTLSAAVKEVPTAPTPAVEGDTGGASSSIPPPTSEETEVVFGWWLYSGAELEAAPVPLARVLSRAHQALDETEAAIWREWEALESKHQRLSDWRTQLEERTKAVSQQFAFELSELTRDHKDYKKDLQRVYARELEASRKEKRLAKKEEGLNQREEVITELSAKLKAMNKILEEQRTQQTTAMERLQKLQQELDDKASVAALAEEKLKAKEQSLERRETDLARREKDLAFWEEMCNTPGFKGQSQVHLIHAPKETTYIIIECIEINVTI
jgi:hypothetical protein